MNILILSAGTRDKVVQYFKQNMEAGDCVIATDCSNMAPAVYEADKHYRVSRMTAPGYIDEILSICKNEKIDGVFSLIDPELSLLAKEREKFEAIGTIPIVSSYELCECCLDKYQMYQKLLEMKIPTGRCYMDVASFRKELEEGTVKFPIFIKPARGSASININKVQSMKEVELLFELYDGLMIQEFMDGQEYGADVYIDMISGKCTSIFIKKKLKMRAGETDKSVSVKDERLFDMIRGFVESCGFRGMIDIDIFKIDGIYYISEVNPRFGGGYPHAYEAGVNIPAQVIHNLKGEVNPVTIGDYEEGVCMMKYNEIMIQKIAENDIVM